MPVVQPRVDYDPFHGDEPRCWVCRQRWPYALSIVFDKHNRKLRIDGADPRPVRAAVAEVLAVLVNSHPRWVSRSQMHEYAYAERPDVDMPSKHLVNSHVSGAKETLVGSRYLIESDQHRGWRLVTEDYLQKERDEYLAQIPGADKRAREDLSRASYASISKTEGARTKLQRRPKRGERKHPKGVLKITKRGEASPKLTNQNQYAKAKRKQLRDVRPK